MLIRINFVTIHNLALHWNAGYKDYTDKSFWDDQVVSNVATDTIIVFLAL